MNATTAEEPQNDTTVTADAATDEDDEAADSSTPAASSTGEVSLAPLQPTALPSAAEFEPPLACVRRILKNALPSSTNVGKDASAAFARASGIFIIYVTACANDFARENKRQTITANDVLAAVSELDFDEFTPDMQSFLELHRSSEKNKKNAKAAAVAAKQSMVHVPSPEVASQSSPAKPSDELSDDEEDDEDAHSAVDDDAAVVAVNLEASSVPDRKRPRPEDDETDSEDGENIGTPTQ